MSRMRLKRGAALLAVALLLTTGAARAQTPAAGAAAPPKGEEHLRVLRKHLTALNAGDAEALKQFAAEHLSERERRGQPPERVAQFELGFRRMVGGGLDLHEVIENADTRLAATLKTRGEFPLFVRMEWTFDAANPSLVHGRALNPTDAPAGALPKAAPEQLAKEVDEKLTRMAAAGDFAGAVLVAKDGKPVWQKAYGYADSEAKAANDLDTRFRLGSMNKMITSVAVAQLVQKGKLKYTDTLADVLPDYPDKEVARKVTIHHLLTHTSGLGDIFGPEFGQKKDALREIRDYVQLFAGKPLRFEPGARGAYSNAGFIVLGLVVEKVSGEGYYDYVRRHIYDVAGMKSSGSTPKTERAANIAVGYMRDGEGRAVPNWETLPWRGMSAGGGESTVGDLLRFAEALRTHRLLNAELTETVISGKTQLGPNASKKYAYGFEESTAGGRRVVGHGGGAPGMNGRLDIHMDSGYTVVVLANLDPPAAERVAGYISGRLR